MRTERLPAPPYRRFLTKVPELEPVGKRTMRLLTGVTYVDSIARVWRAPPGWIFDGASVPAFAQAAFAPFDVKTIRPAALHDVRFCVHDLSFRASNLLFREALQVEAWPFTDLFYRAVGSPLGWWSYWITPAIAANAALISKMESDFEAHGPEIWTPETAP